MSARSPLDLLRDGACLLLGKLHTHFGSCQIDRMLISANEVLGFQIEIDLLSCDDAAGGVSSTLQDLTIACVFCLGQAEAMLVLLRMVRKDLAQ